MLHADYSFKNPVSITSWKTAFHDSMDTGKCKPTFHNFISIFSVELSPQPGPSSRPDDLEIDETIEEVEEFVGFSQVATQEQVEITTKVCKLGQIEETVTMVSPKKVLALWDDALEHPIKINEEVKIPVSKSKNKLVASTSLEDLLTQHEEEWEKNPQYLSQALAKKPRQSSSQKILVTDKMMSIIERGSQEDLVAIENWNPNEEKSKNDDALSKILAWSEKRTSEHFAFMNREQEIIKEALALYQKK